MKKELIAMLICFIIVRAKWWYIESNDSGDLVRDLQTIQIETLFRLNWDKIRSVSKLEHLENLLVTWRINDYDRYTQCFNSEYKKVGCYFFCCCHNKKLIKNVSFLSNVLEIKRTEGPLSPETATCILMWYHMILLQC